MSRLSAFFVLFGVSVGCWAMGLLAAFVIFNVGMWFSERFRK